MMNRSMSAHIAALCICSVAMITGACRKAASPAQESGGAAAATAHLGAAAGEKYPEPRWPSYFKPPKGIDDLMPAARALVRNQSGLQGKGMGILAQGESVLIVAANDADPMVLDAIKRALGERKITPYIKFVYEMTGETKEQAAADQKRRSKGQQIEDAGIYQASAWITGQFPDPAEPKAWLKKRNPKVYAKLFPGENGAEPVATGQRQKPRGEGTEDADTGAVGRGRLQRRGLRSATPSRTS